MGVRLDIPSYAHFKQKVHIMQSNKFDPIRLKLSKNPFSSRIKITNCGDLDKVKLLLGFNTIVPTSNNNILLISNTNWFKFVYVLKCWMSTFQWNKFHSKIYKLIIYKHIKTLWSFIYIWVPSSNLYSILTQFYWYTQIWCFWH